MLLAIILYGAFTVSNRVHLIDWSLTALNIAVFAVMTYTIARYSEESISKRAILELQLRVYESERKKIYGAYTDYMNGPDLDSEERFDKFRDSVNEFIRKMIIIDKAWSKSVEVEWFVTEFKRIKEMYKTKRSIETGLLSADLSAHIERLFSEVSKCH